MSQKVQLSKQAIPSGARTPDHDLQSGAHTESPGADSDSLAHSDMHTRTEHIILQLPTLF